MLQILILLNFNSCVNFINKQLNYDVKKTYLESKLKIKLNGKNLYETDSVKYLGIQLDKNLTWKQEVAIKLRGH